MLGLVVLQEVRPERDGHLVELRQGRRALRLGAADRVDHVADDRADHVVGGAARLGALGQDAQVVRRRRRHPEQRTAGGGVAVVAEAVGDLEGELRVVVQGGVGEQAVLVEHVVPRSNVALVDRGPQERVEELHHR